MHPLLTKAIHSLVKTERWSSLTKHSDSDERNCQTLTSSWRYYLIEQLGTRPFPDLSDDGTQFLIGAVDVAVGFDVKRRADESE